MTKNDAIWLTQFTDLLKTGMDNLSDPHLRSAAILFLHELKASPFSSPSGYTSYTGCSFLKDAFQILAEARKRTKPQKKKLGNIPRLPLDSVR